MKPYVHGYDDGELVRLEDQAGILSDLLHREIRYRPGEEVLEAGCGVGAQTLFLARNSPDARFTSIDISAESIATARLRLSEAGITNVALEETDLFALHPGEKSFDSIFVCFLLEHLSEPVRALCHLRSMLRPGGRISVIEGDHGSFFCHPETALSRRVVRCLVELQRECGGDSLIGRKLHPLLKESGYRGIEVSPRTVYADAGRPEWVEGFSRRTFIKMIEGVRDRVLERDMISPDNWNRGIGDLYRATERDGTFCYTFFRAFAYRDPLP